MRHELNHCFAKSIHQLRNIPFQHANLPLDVRGLKVECKKHRSTCRQGRQSKPKKKYLKHNARLCKKQQQILRGLNWVSIDANMLRDNNLHPLMQSLLWCADLDLSKNYHFYIIFSRGSRWNFFPQLSPLERKKCCGFFDIKFIKFRQGEVISTWKENFQFWAISPIHFNGAANFEPPKFSWQFFGREANIAQTRQRCHWKGKNVHFICAKVQNFSTSGTIFADEFFFSETVILRVFNRK